MKKILVLSLLTIFIVGCGGGDNTEEDAVSSSSGSVDVNVEEGGVAINVDGDTDAEDKSDDKNPSNSEDATCLIGSWEMNNFSEYLAASMSGAGMPVEASHTGSLIMSFDESNMVMSSNAFVVTVNMMGMTVPVDINAAGTVGYTADNETITTLGNGSANVDGEALGTSSSFGIGSFAMNSNEYTCSGNDLRWLSDGGNLAVDTTFTRI